MLRGKGKTLNAYFRKEEKSKINSLSFHHKKLEKEQNIFKSSRKSNTDNIRHQ